MKSYREGLALCSGDYYHLHLTGPGITARLGQPRCALPTERNGPYHPSHTLIIFILPGPGPIPAPPEASHSTSQGWR